MKNAEMYRKNAEDCKQLAQQAPQHRDALLEIAAAWTALAERAEQGDDAAKGDSKAKE